MRGEYPRVEKPGENERENDCGPKEGDIFLHINHFTRRVANVATNVGLCIKKILLRTESSIVKFHKKF